MQPLKNNSILIPGSTGLVGSAIVRRLQKDGCRNLLTPTHAELDLTDQKAVADYFARHRPSRVYMAAARVGGILANNTYPADFIHENLVIQNNLIHQSFVHNVEKVIFLGSSCIYPKHCPQPMAEEHLLTGPLEPTNEPYAIAKIAGIEMCWAYNRQHNTRFIPVMPTNLYGPNDNFDLETSHVMAALIRKFHLARVTQEGHLRAIAQDEAQYGTIPDNILHALGLKRSSGDISSKASNFELKTLNPRPQVVLWGTGAPKREFLHVDDLADACVFLMNQPDNAIDYKNRPLFNIGTGKDLSIASLAQLIKEITGYKGEITYDTSKPDGTPQKLLDVTRMNTLGWHAQTSLEQGIRHAYNWYKDVQRSKFNVQR